MFLFFDPLHPKTGKTFRGGSRLTTMDAMQLLTKYCVPRGVEMKKNADCPRPDPVGIYRKIFWDRICDGIEDCDGGDDENGNMAPCINAAPPTQNGCCSILTIFGRDCKRVGLYKSRDYYQCGPNPNDVVFYFDTMDTWYVGSRGIPVGNMIHLNAKIHQDGGGGSMTAIVQPQTQVKFGHAHPCIRIQFVRHWDYGHMVA